MAPFNPFCFWFEIYIEMPMEKQSVSLARLAAHLGGAFL